MLSIAKWQILASTVFIGRLNLVMRARNLKSGNFIGYPA